MSIAYLVRYHYTNLGILGFGAHTQKDINIVIIVNWYRNTLTIMLLIILWVFFWLDAVVHFQGEFLIQKANSSKQNNETSCYLWPRKQCEKASNSFIRRKKKLKNKYMILSVSVCHTRHLVKKSSHMIFRCGFWKKNGNIRLVNDDTKPSVHRKGSPKIHTKIQQRKNYRKFSMFQFFILLHALKIQLNEWPLQCCPNPLK